MFLKPMRLPVFIIFCVTILFTSCGQYQKVLRKDDLGKKYTFADSLYQIGKYKKALKLMEKLVLVYRENPKGERLLYIFEVRYFKLVNIFFSGSKFKSFVRDYQKGIRTELV